MRNGLFCWYRISVLVVSGALCPDSDIVPLRWVGGAEGILALGCLGVYGGCDVLAGSGSGDGGPFLGEVTHEFSGFVLGGVDGLVEGDASAFPMGVAAE